MMSIIRIYLIIAIFIEIIFVFVVCENRKVVKWAEKELIRHLFKDYDKHSRPVSDLLSIRANLHNKSAQPILQVLVEFGLSLIQILELNEIEQVLTTSVRTLYRWTDYGMTWNPAHYNNIRSVNIPASSLWIPDISIYNYADDRMEELKPCNAIVSYDGTVEWYPMAVFKSSCPVETKNFPYDYQMCQMKFGPWTYDGYRVNMTFYDSKAYLFRNEYITSAEWEIINTTAFYTSVIYPCCVEPFVDISFFVLLKRNTAFHNYLIIMPCFLLSLITIAIFLIPPDSPTKLLLGVNILTAYSLQLLVLKKSTPVATSSYPILTFYYCVNISLLTLTIYVSIFVIDSQKNGYMCKPVPPWIRRILCLLNSNMKVKLNQKIILHKFQNNKLEYKRGLISNFARPYYNNYNRRPYNIKIDHLYCITNEILEDIITKRSHEQTNQTNQEAWYLFASILDKLFLSCYLVLLMITICFFFPSLSLPKIEEQWYNKTLKL